MDGTDQETGEIFAEDIRTAGRFGSPVAERVNDLLAPAMATLGAELVDVVWAGGTLRIVADRPDGITIDGLAEINRLVSPILDQHDPVPGRYTLEVSSPGVERPLRRPDHFRRAVGETVIVKAIPGVDPRRVKGLLRSFEGEVLEIDVVEIDGVDLAEVEPHSISLDEIDTARTHFEWGPAPKPGKGGKRAKGANRGTGGRKPTAGEKKGGEPAQPTTEEERERP